MSATLLSITLPLAVHIPDGFLTAPWLVGGFVIAGLLALVSAYRIRDEEIPRVALLSAAFFVATLMHLPLGPASVHLLLCGLVGVVLGRRAPLAILLGLSLQAALFGHGGLTSIGINSCVQTIPALLSGWLFSMLCLFPAARRGNGTVLWSIGCFIGMISVLTALILEAIVLLFGGITNWSEVVVILFVAHLPVVAVEGIVLGFTVSFLARIKPEMLGLRPVAKHDLTNYSVAEAVSKERTTNFSALPQTGLRAAGTEIRLPALVLAGLSLFLAVKPAYAHRLNAGYVVLKDQNVRIESWFDLGGVPKGAMVEVYRPQRRLLVKGKLDANGCYTFHYDEIEPLEVIVSTGDGHRKPFTIPQADLQSTGKATLPSLVNDPTEIVRPLRDIDEAAVWRERFKEALLGVSFLLSLATFILAWRQTCRLRALERDRMTFHPADNPVRNLE